MKKANPKVDWFFEKAPKWQAEFKKLRSILLSTPLTEELKWGVPCYTLDGKNVVLMHGFKEYCALLFPKGALLKDPQGILVQQTENVQAARQIRFTKLGEIVKLAPTLKAYVAEAVGIEKAGLKVPLKKTSEFKMPDELKKRLAVDDALNEAFKALTPGRQRAYILYFSAAKQSATRTSRIEKCVPQILDGLGLND